METFGGSSLSILIPIYMDYDLAIQCISSAIKFKESKQNFFDDINIIISDDTPNFGLLSRIKNISEIEKKCIFIEREFNNKKSAVSNWNFLLDFAFKTFPHSYYLVLHHDEEIVLSSFHKVKLKKINILPLIGVVQRRRYLISRIITKVILKTFPKSLYLINIIGSPSCVIFKDHILYDERLNWLVDVDFYNKLLFKNVFKNEIRVVNFANIKTNRNDNSITSTLDVVKLEKFEAKLLGIYSLVILFKIKHFIKKLIK